MVVELAGGFAVVGAGAWLFGRAQPAAVRGTLRSRGLKGFICPDRGSLTRGELADDGSHAERAESAESAEHGARAWCASSACPFLTRIDCGAPVTAVSDKVLVAPAAARSGARLLRVVPMSFARSIRTTEFSSEWVVTATRSRTTRVALDEGESLGVRPDAAVAWTGARPTGFCPRLRLLDVLLPRGPRDLLLHFHGPAIVWIEGSQPLPLRKAAPRRAVF
ncbi:MAG: hypothetical protein IJV65_04555 [Kiritimatiellae bacterium]|nr:hypothetical protein [Kiritimatiellia bacterium]